MKRILAALCLLAGPAFAQAPPPVPALPDAPRISPYTLSASTCNCSVGFGIYADNSTTDIDNWVQVWISASAGTTATRYLSTDPTFGWSLSSPTGSLALIPRPITDAVLTFNSPQTGYVVILGATRPRRLIEFAENRGVPARDHNQALNSAFAELRETWDKLNGAIIGQPGETPGRLPAAATRANQVLAFDGAGNPTVVAVPASIPSSTVVGPGSSVLNHPATWCNTLGTLLCDTAILGVPVGGTGATTFATHGVLLGEGTSAFGVATIGTSGRILIDQGAAADPMFVAPSGAFTINGAGVATLGVGVVTGTNIAAGTVTNSNLANMAANTIKGSVAGGAPADLTAAQAGTIIYCAPQRTVLISGTAQTYTTPTCNGLTATWLEVELQGGGSGGASTGSPGNANGSVGNASLFGALTANGASATTTTYTGGVGGTCTGSLGTQQNFPGNAGGSGVGTSASVVPGGWGGMSYYGGAGAPGIGGSGFTGGGSAPANSGGGGAGGSGTGTASVGSAAGGGAGCHISTIIAPPAATYTYTVGGTSNGATAGTNGTAGGNGAAGLITVVAHWQ